MTFTTFMAAVFIIWGLINIRKIMNLLLSAKNIIDFVGVFIASNFILLLPYIFYVVAKFLFNI